MSETFTTQCDLFLAILRHDISNYNQTSRGYLEMLLDEQMGPISEDQARALATCLRQCARVQNAIDNLRVLQELEHQPVRLSSVNLDQSIREAIEAIQQEFSDREIRLHFTAADRYALADEHLVTVFRQLFSNAVRYNDAEVVEIDVEIRHESEPEPRWKIRVIDNGNGIPSFKQDGLFDRLDKREVRGSGLGLPIVKALLERWGGSISLEHSKPGEGAIFALTLLPA